MDEENVKYKATGYIFFFFFFYKPSSCDKINDKVHQIIQWLQWPSSDQLIRRLSYLCKRPLNTTENSTDVYECYSCPWGGIFYIYSHM